MRLILDNDTIKFEPEFEEYIDILQNVYDVMIKVVNFVPRVETKLYSKWVSERTFFLLRFAWWRSPLVTSGRYP